MAFTEDEEQDSQGAARETAAPDPAQPQAEDPDSLRQALEKEKTRAEQLLSNWQRAQADYANMRRRVEQEKQDLARFANASLIATLLPALDDLERALEHATGKLAGLTWVDGIRLIYAKLQAILQAHGVAPIKAVGEAFDPRLHEAVLYGEGEEGRVVDELQKGYTLHGRLVRPAMVRVGQGRSEPGKPEETPPDQTQEETPTPEQGAAP